MIRKPKAAPQKQFLSTAAGNKVYSHGSFAPTRGTVNPVGYIKRELDLKNQKPSRSGLAKAAVARFENTNRPSRDQIKSSVPPQLPSRLSAPIKTKATRPIGGPRPFDIHSGPFDGNRPIDIHRPPAYGQPGGPSGHSPEPLPQYGRTPPPVGGGIPILNKPDDMSMDDWTRLDPNTGMSLMQKATYYKNGQELRQQFQHGGGVINAAKGVKGAYKDPHTGQWVMDMKPQNLAAYLAWNQNKAQTGDSTWYRKGAQQQALPAYTPDTRARDTATSVFDDYLNAQGMGWAPNGNFSDSNMINAGATKNPDGTWKLPDWYNALGPGQASATGYQRQTPYGMMSHNAMVQGLASGQLQPLPQTTDRGTIHPANTGINGGNQGIAVGEPNPNGGLNLIAPGGGPQAAMNLIHGPQAMQGGPFLQNSPQQLTTLTTGHQNPQQMQQQGQQGNGGKGWQDWQKAAQNALKNKGNKNKPGTKPNNPGSGGGQQGPGGGGQQGPGGQPQPTPPQSIQVNENGQLDLPYDENFSWDLLNAKQDMNSQLLDLQNQQQAQAMQFAQMKRDAGKDYDNLKRDTLNHDASRGMAFSSGYGKHVADNATEFNNYMSDLEGQNQLFNQGIDTSRMQIGNAFNDMLRQAALQRAQGLEPDAGSLGYGQSTVENSIPKPNFPGGKSQGPRPGNGGGKSNSKPGSGKGGNKGGHKGRKHKPRPKKGPGYRAEHGKGR